MYVLGHTNETVFELVLDSSSSGSSSTNNTTIEVPRASIQHVDIAQYCDQETVVSVELEHSNPAWDYRYTVVDNEAAYSAWNILGDGISFFLDTIGEQNLFLQFRSKTGAVQTITHALNISQLTCEESTEQIETSVDEIETEIEEAVGGSEIQYGPSPITGALEVIDEVLPETFIRGASFEAIYYVNEQLERQPFPDQETQDMYINDDTYIYVVSDATLPTLTMGVPMVPNTPATLIRTDYDEHTYQLISENEVEIIEPQVAKETFGSFWQNLIIHIDNVLFARFRIR